MSENFIPLALDTYFRGNSQEFEFCQEAGAGGNHLVAVTASGKTLGDGKGNRGHVMLREKDLAPLLEEFQALPEAERKPALPDPDKATPPKRPVPDPPENGLIIRGFCTYMKRSPGGVPSREPKFYYRQNPDAWAAETQSDMLWLTEKEWRSLIPEKPGPGLPFEASPEIQRRLFSTLGIDYMEGSVNALPVRESKLTLKPWGPTKGYEVLDVSGSAKLGKPQGPDTKTEPRTRGCEIEIFGKITYDAKTKKIVSLDIAGVGTAWGNKMEYVKRAISTDDYPWHYGIALELVTGDSAYDLVPPYNLLHYGGGMKYFGGE